MYFCLFVQIKDKNFPPSICVYMLLLIASAAMISSDAHIAKIATNLGWFNSFLVASLSAGEK